MPPITPEDLRRALALPAFDGLAGQRPMTPRSRGAAARVDPGTPWREGAALAYVFPAERGLAFPLTLRREDLREHRGQVSLPGGRPDPGEDLWTTAVREAEEEVGLSVAAFERLGVLHPVDIPHTHSRLFVHVALGADPRPLRPRDAEVARLVLGSLDDLLDPAARLRTTRRVDDRDVEVPCFLLGGLEVWGATAMALSEWAERLRRVVQPTAGNVT